MNGVVCHKIAWGDRMSEPRSRIAPIALHFIKNRIARVRTFAVLKNDAAAE